MDKAGWPIDSVQAVICTHLHVDHVGWNTRLENGRWVPTFPNARYFIGCADQPTPVIGTHFAQPTAGRVRRDGAAYRFDVVR
jgi:glyoxylase-like metal-dependent hydrolase (beta-lactamase superfamily II)